MNNKENKPVLISLEDNVKNRMLVAYFRGVYENHVSKYDLLNNQIEGLIKDKTPIDNPILQDALKERNNIVSDINSIRKKTEAVLFNTKRHDNAKTVKNVRAFAGKL